MEYRRLGNTGLKLSVLSLGSWVTFGNQVDLDGAVKLLARAYDAGINFFDNAEVYALGESEKLMGDALRQLGWRRGSYTVSTKIYWGLHDSPLEKNTLNRKRLLEGMEGALARFGLDTIDLVFCHRDDLETSVEEIVLTMHEIVSSGKAFYWGTSEWTPERIEEAIAFATRHGLHAPVMEQPQYSLLKRSFFEQRLGPALKRHRYGTTTWSPLALGILAGRYDQGIPEGSRLDKVDWLRAELTEERIAASKQLGEVAAELGCTRAQLALAWVAKNPLVSTVITGASQIGQLEENLGALEVIPKLTPEILARIDSLFPA